jgi:AcrR family transcriptional regulator
MSRRERRKQETLERIERAGWRLFTSQGYEATSTREIALAADIGTGTLFNYFPEKRALLIHLMRKRLDAAAHRALETMPDGTLEEQLAQLFSALTRCYARERRISRVFVKELLFTDGSLREETAAWTFNLVKLVSQLVDAAQARGELDRSAASLELAQQIFSTHYFGLVTWLGGTLPSRQAQEAQVEASVRLLLRGARLRRAAS